VLCAVADALEVLEEVVNEYFRSNKIPDWAAA
jgi:hypothetical protein